MQTKQVLKASALALILSACGNSKDVVAPPVEQPVNLSNQLMMSTLWMQHAAECRVLQKQQYKTAETLLEKNMQKFKGEKRPAVILDIDETVLDNSPYEARMIKNGTGYTPESWEQWVNEAQASLVPGASDFLKKAESLGVEVFYISNRDAKDMERTIQNLQMYNLPSADEGHTFLKADESNKTERRERVKSEFKVVLLIGDQLTDFMEETEVFSFDDSDRQSIMDSVLNYFVMLPNPMYGSFEKNLYKGQSGLTDKQKDQYRKDALIIKRRK